MILASWTCFGGFGNRRLADSQAEDRTADSISTSQQQGIHAISRANHSWYRQGRKVKTRGDPLLLKSHCNSPLLIRPQPWSSCPPSPRRRTTSNRRSSNSFPKPIYIPSSRRPSNTSSRSPSTDTPDTSSGSSTASTSSTRYACVSWRATT